LPGLGSPHPKRPTPRPRAAAPYQRSRPRPAQLQAPARARSSRQAAACRRRRPWLFPIVEPLSASTIRPRTARMIQEFRCITHRHTGATLKVKAIPASPRQRHCCTLFMISCGTTRLRRSGNGPSLRKLTVSLLGIEEVRGKCEQEARAGTTSQVVKCHSHESALLLQRSRRFRVSGTLVSQLGPVRKAATIRLALSMYVSKVSAPVFPASKSPFSYQWIK
jgi:hypothetical protein